MDQCHESDYLQHYGVLGMKWGVRRNRSKAFAKASKKARKLNERAVATNLKSATLSSKALKKERRARSERQYKKARKIQYKANTLNLTSAKLQKKAMKWEKAMSKVFSDVKMSEISPEALDSGRKYAYMLMRD